MVSKRQTGLTIFEPTDNVVSKCHPDVYGFSGIKSGYFVKVVQKAHHVVTGAETHGALKRTIISKPVVVTDK